jgi:light-regulated signal transduction histidine kinase (bacteriophytochrome)
MKSGGCWSTISPSSRRRHFQSSRRVEGWPWAGPQIVQDLKNFSRVGEQEWQEADLHQGIDSTLNIVWNELKYKAKVVKEYGQIPHVFCLISQLNQVFMNLLVNAGHAIEKQGTITIRTSLHGNDKVCVEISDTGKGIAPEHINRIFEPFFNNRLAETRASVPGSSNAQRPNEVESAGRHHFPSVTAHQSKTEH